jgi:DNA-directed RNA polymerase specialized sigma24 family protein
VRKERVHEGGDRLLERGVTDKGFEQIAQLDYIGIGLLQLTDAQRLVIRMRYLEGYDLRSIALATNRSVEATKSLHHRAIQALRTALSEVDRMDTMGGTLSLAGGR